MTTRGVGNSGIDNDFAQEGFEDTQAGNEFATALDQIREECGLTQEQIASKAGIAAGRISDMRGGHFYAKEKTRATYLEKIGKAIIDLESRIKLPLVNALLPPVRLLPEHKAALLATFAAYKREKKQPRDLLERLTPDPSDLSVYERYTSVSSLVGRDKELYIILEALIKDATSIVTITGTTGVGKTKLVLEVAKRLHTDTTVFPGKYKFIRLTEMKSASHIAHAIATALGVSGILIESIVASLPTARTLLILDNLEFVQESKEFILSFLWTCQAQNKKVTLLITSQNPLDIDTRLQTTIPLEPLALPPYDATPTTLPELKLYEATNLFYQRMSQQMQLYPLTQDDIKAITALCKQLDGLPLAIELAAPTISETKLPQGIYDSFMKNLASLHTTLADVDPRHKSLVAALAWSYDQLTPTQQKLLRRLSIFSGSFTLEAVQEICNAPGDIHGNIEALFLDLVRRNQIQAENIPGIENIKEEGTTWYILLNSIRRYARQKLASDREVEEIEKMHCFYFLLFELKLVVEMQVLIPPGTRGNATTNELLQPQLKLLLLIKDNMLDAIFYLKHHPHVKEDLAGYINAAGITSPSHVPILITALENGYLLEN